MFIPHAKRIGIEMKQNKKKIEKQNTILKSR